MTSDSPIEMKKGRLEARLMEVIDRASRLKTRRFAVQKELWDVVCQEYPLLRLYDFMTPPEVERWLAAPNSSLDGVRPVELLGTEREKEIYRLCDQMTSGSFT